MMMRFLGLRVRSKNVGGSLVISPFSRAVICLAILFISAPVFAWNVSSYDTKMIVKPDSSVLVSVTITADFTNDPNHGIIRKLPLSGKDKYGNNYRLRHYIIGVTDADGHKLPARISVKGGWIVFKIGDPDTYVTGEQTYVIHYNLLRVVHFFDQHDEIYWNPVGNEWTVPVSNATCEVYLPKDVPRDQLVGASYTGYYGATATEAVFDTPDGRTLRFSMTRTLNPGEGMTIVAGWPKRLVNPPSSAHEAWWFVTDNGYFFLPPLFLVGLVIFWVRAGKDPDTGRSEMVAYDPPEGMNPAEIGTLIDERVDMRDITASIVDLAVRGFIRIKADKQKGFLTTKTDYTLELTRPYGEARGDASLTQFEQDLVKGLFNGMDFCHMSGLERHFYVHIPKLRDRLYDSMVKRGYFTHRPDKIRSSYVAAGGGLLVVGLIAGMMLLGAAEVPSFFAVSAGWGFALAVCGIFLAMFARAMPRKTIKGKNALIGVRGFEEYMTRAERAEIEHQERNDIFEKFLPYAIALGVADKWANAFDGIQKEPPQWYDGYDGAFHPTIFVRDLDHATHGWAHAMTSQPRSSGDGGGGSSFFGGGSGFSGGSSGGGGGGGGGSSW